MVYYYYYYIPNIRIRIRIRGSSCTDIRIYICIRGSPSFDICMCTRFRRSSCTDIRICIRIRGSRNFGIQYISIADPVFDGVRVAFESRANTFLFSLLHISACSPLLSAQVYPKMWINCLSASARNSVSLMVTHQKSPIHQTNYKRCYA